MNVQKVHGKGAELIWHDRKRVFGLPLSFTRYRLVNRPGVWFKVFSDVGFTYSALEEVNLYRVCDISLRQSLIGKMLNTGTVILSTNDERAPVFVMKNIKDPFKVREMFSNYVEEQRRINNVRLTEFHSHS